MANRLLAHHTEDLRRSGLGDESIEALGFYSGTAAEVKDILGFDAGPGLVIPYPTSEGQQPFSRVKPDQPPIIDGKPAKYLSPQGAMVRAYFPPRTWQALKDPRATVIMTEGEKKAAKADQEGFFCIGLGGVWGFSQEHRLILDLASLSWEGRPVVICFDTDPAPDPHINLGSFTLERWLSGANVLVVRFPLLEGKKTGLDDFLVIQGVESFKQLLAQAKPIVAWEIDDIACLQDHVRYRPLKALFRKLSLMEPVEVLPWKRICREKLGISAGDFNRQIKIAQEEQAQREMKRLEQLWVEEEEQIKANVEECAAKLRPKALELLRNPALLYLVGRTIQRLGVAGEDINIRVLYLAITSRITDEPISVTPKGESSSGKSYVVLRVLLLFPSSAYLALTGMSKQALIYMEGESFAHRTLVVFERAGAEASDYNIRTLQSEGKLIFWVAEKDPVTNQWVTRRVEKEGPTNFIITTTSAELRPENETRHWSLLMDESPELTLAAKVESAKRYMGEGGVSEEELAVWRQAQKELRPLKVRIPYARWLAEHTPHQPLRIRRDFNKLLILINVVALLHQHQREVGIDGTLNASLADYFMARVLVGKIFPASLAGINEKVEALMAEVERLYEEKLATGEENPAVKPGELVSPLGTSTSSVSRWLRPAIEAGLIDVVSETPKGRIQAVRPRRSKFQISGALPTVEELAEAFPELAKDFRAVHPLTSEEFALKEEARAKSEKIFE